MKIDRHNYEEFFILYLDNELSDADRRVVESFVSLHPDLKEELELLSQFKLQPDASLHFPSKESLLKPAIKLEISGEELLMHLDGELRSEESEKIQQAIDNNSYLQQEFSLLQKTKLVAEEIVFPDKSVLYRRSTEPARIVSVRWYRVAAAVILLLLAGSAIVLINNSRQNGEAPEVVKNLPPGSNKLPLENEQQKENLLANDEQISPENKNSDGKEEKTLVIENHQRTKQTDVPQPEQQPGSNNLPEPVNDHDAIALNENKPRQTVDPETKFSNDAVTSLSPEPLNNVVQARYPDPGRDNDLEQEPAGGKNKLRGLFRKVTRTLEKRTNIDATDNEERLLVAGLSIKLK